jgi:hypothetical protein
MEGPRPQAMHAGITILGLPASLDTRKNRGQLNISRIKKQQKPYFLWEERIGDPA